MEECAICLNPVRTTRHSETLECNHIFHKYCFDNWKSSGGTTCPLCRERVVEKPLYNVTLRVENTQTGNVQEHTTQYRTDELGDINIVEMSFDAYSLDDIRAILSPFPGSDFNTLLFDTE